LEVSNDWIVLFLLFRFLARSSSEEFTAVGHGATEDWMRIRMRGSL
jgi:hypothetical protein